MPMYYVFARSATYVFRAAIDAAFFQLITAFMLITLPLLLSLR